MSELPKSINNTFDLGVKVLTPLHIGSGKEKEWSQGIDFYQNGNEVVKINQNKLAASVEDSKDLVDIFLGISTKKIADIVRKNREAIEFQFDFPFTATREIKSNIRTGINNHPYVPGSSLKGAIASILAKYLGFSDRNKKVLGSATDGSALMRFIKITDAHFEKTELIQTKIFNLFEDSSAKTWKGGWKHGGNLTNKSLYGRGGELNQRFASTYEVISTKQSTEIKIRLAKEVLENYLTNPNINSHSFSPQKKNIINGTQQQLFAILNEHTKAYIQKEIKFLTTYSNKETPQIIETFKWLLNEIPKDNSYCILKMAAGSGFHSITGDWCYDNYDLQPWSKNDYQKHGIPFKRQRNLTGKKFKSRKIAITKHKGQLQFKPMGFILLGPIDRVYKLGLTQEEAGAQKEVERLEIEKAERLAKEQAAKAAKERAIQEKEQARLAMEQEAGASFGKAKQLNTKEAYQNFITTFPKSELRIQAEELVQKIRQQEKSEAAKAATTIDLVFNNYKFDTIKKLLNGLLNKHSKKGFQFSENQQKQIVVAINKSWELENKNPKKSAFRKKGKILPFNKYPWTDIIKWLGEEKAQELYNQIIN